MKKILLLHLDGKFPNIALMRIAAHYSQDDLTLRYGTSRKLWDSTWDQVFASAIFAKTQPAIQQVKQEFPNAVIGGTGYSLDITLEQYGITTRRQEYRVYPKFQPSIGFTQRGCRLRCSFCVVGRKEGAVRTEQSIWEIWRGEPWPRENDFFGQECWRERIREMQDGRFKICFSQGINARFLTDEAAESLAAVEYRDDSMKTKRLYTAWDNRHDEERLFAGLNRLVKAGINPDDIMVYILIGYWPQETHEDRDYRRRRLREFGARPYPMPYIRTAELVGFQRWVIGAYDKTIPWKQWAHARYQPIYLKPDPTFPLLEGQP